MWLKRSAHQRARELLSAYIDGELSPQEKALVEGHLRECADCRQELETLRRTVAILRDAPRPVLPRSFVIRRADLEKAPALSCPPAFLRVVAALGAAAFVLVVGVYFLMQVLLPMALAPMGKAPPPEKGYRAFEETPTIVVEVEKVVTKEVAKEVPAPAVGSKEALETPAPELGVEVHAISPVPIPTATPPVALAPSEEPSAKPAALPTPTPAPSYGGELLAGRMWAVVALALAGLGIGLWAYYSKRKS